MINFIHEKRDSVTIDLNQATAEYFANHDFSTYCGTSEVLGIPAISRGLDLICNQVALMPCPVYRKTPIGRQVANNHPAYSLLNRQPNSEETPFDFFKTTMLQTLLYGNSFIYVDRQGLTPVQLLHLDPINTYIFRENGVKGYLTTINGQTIKIHHEDVIHIKNKVNENGMGISITSQLGDALGVASSIIRYTKKYFENGGKPSVVITLPLGLDNPEDIERFRKTWGQAHEGLKNSHKVALLENGATVSTIGGNNEAAQVNQLTENQITECANILNLPVDKLGGKNYTSFNSLEQMDQSFLNYSINPWLVQLEQQFEKALLLPSELTSGEIYIEYNRDSVLSINAETRDKILTNQLNNNILSWEEVRSLINKPIDKKSGQFFRSANVQIVDENFEPITKEPEVQIQSNQDQPNNQLRQLTNQTVDRLVTRMKKFVESKGLEADIDSQEQIFRDSLNMFDCEVSITSFFGELKEELRRIMKEDISKIDWNKKKQNIIEGLK